MIYLNQNSVVYLISVLVRFSTQIGQCERCVPVEQCPVVQQLSRSDQARVMRELTCDVSPGSRTTVPYGFSPIAAGDHVCCSNITPNRFPNSVSSSSNQPNRRFNGNQFGASPGGLQNRSLNGLLQSRNPNTNINTQLINGQCKVSSFPPNPNSGCCGREESDGERTTDDGVTIPMPSTSPAPTSPARSTSSPPRSTSSPARATSSAEQPTSSPTPARISSTTLNWMNYFMGRTTSQAPRVKRSNETFNVTIDNRISGGKITEIDQFPWTVLLQAKFRYDQGVQAFNCGGSLISSRYVLTAAHCVHEQGVPLEDVEIYLAEFDKSTFPIDCVNSYGERRCVENIVMHAEDVVIHPEYDETLLQNDIALLRLQGNAPYNDFIRPICLPSFDIDSTTLRNLPLSVAGWGRNGPFVSNVKQYTVVNLVPQNECRKNYAYLTRRHLCAAGNSGEDTCKGDSGGPLMMTFEGKYFIAGVVSGKRKDSPCGSAVPSLYTNVYHYMEWMANVIKN